MEALVTIVTPTFNRRGLVADSVRSVLAQTYSAIEYIIVDDGSTDGTADFLEREFPNVTVERGRNVGQVMALEHGWRLSRGSYLSYLSDDDILMPDAVRLLVGYLQTHPEAVAVYPDSYIIDEGGNVVVQGVGRPFSLSEAAIGTEIYIGPGAIFRRKDYDAIGGWNPRVRLAPDREFWMRMASRGEIAFLPMPLALYRVHQKSTSVERAGSNLAEEYVWVANEFFDGPFCPVELRGRKSRALANAHLKAARMHLSDGAFAAANRSMRSAMSADISCLTRSAITFVAAGLVPFTLRSWINCLRR